MIICIIWRLYIIECVKSDGVWAWNLDTRCEHSPWGYGNDVAIGYTTGFATEQHAGVEVSLVDRIHF